MRQKGFVNLLLPILLIVVVVFIAGFFYFSRSGVKISITTPTPSSLNKPPQSSLFSGKLTQLNQDLGLFKPVSYNAPNVPAPKYSYYSAGIFTKGNLDGYTRIVVIPLDIGPGEPLTLTLATKDFKTYTLDDPNNNVVNYPESDSRNPFYFLDKSKVTSISKFDTDTPQQIDLDNNYSLFFDSISTHRIQLNTKDQYGNYVYQNTLTTDFSMYESLNNPGTNLNFYFIPYTNGNFNGANGAADLVTLEKKYIKGETSILAVDSTGLPVTYDLTTKSDISRYNSEKTVYDQAQISFENQLQKYNNKEITQYPTYPSNNYPTNPNLGFKSSDISNTQVLNFYNQYLVLAPFACSSSTNAKVVDISDSDVKQIGTVNNLPLYNFKDSNNDLNKIAYQTKIGIYSNAPVQEFSIVNKGLTQPTFDEYVSKNPVLLIKDYWGRWIALGEYDYLLPGGCGKPVIYLYPKVPTKVTLQFNAPMQFTTDIPTYKNSWQVMAQPNGLLTNLRPELTDCNSFKYPEFGSEYAYTACLNNKYPYLYWSGNVLSQNYTEPNEGWIVERQDLSNFMKNKLTGLGLNTTEESDFLSYWFPKMLSKESPYYKISFLTTNELNSLFPMTIIPRPDTIFRIFLDYQPREILPSTSPQPQVLNKLVRNGFTLVEWGGLNH